MIAKNKQNLLLFKKQLKTVQKSRKLLDEKLSGLVKAFHETVIEGYILEEKIKKNTQSIVGNYLWTSSFVSSQKLVRFAQSSLHDTTTSHYQLTSDIKKYFGVSLPQLSLTMRPLDIEAGLRPTLYNSLHEFNDKMPLFLQLLQTQIKCELLAKEIAKTNRLIANIDIRIEDMEETIKKIKAYLLEKENETKAILLKIKASQ